MQVRKEVMRSGRHVYIDADGKPAVKDATAADIQRWAKDSKEMLALGLPIPIPLEHDTQAHPLNAADLAAQRVRNNTGFVQDFATDVITDKDGEQVHRLLSVLDIRDEATAKQVQNETIPFVSPWFSSFTDGKGRKWEDVIAHVALTTRPRIADQAKFESIPAMLSIAEPVAKFPDSGICLSRAGLLKKNGKPKHLAAFSLMTGIKLSEEEFEEAEKESEEDAEKEVKRKSPLDDDTSMECADVSIHEMIGHLLKAMGMNPPDGMSEATFERDIYETLMAKMREMVADKHNKPEERPGEQQQQQRQPVQQETPPMYMSLTKSDIAKIADPKEKAQAEAFFSLKEGYESLKKNRLDEATATRQQRVEKICKMLPKDTRDRVAAALSTPGAQLSLNNDGSVNDPMSVMLSALEDGLSVLDEQLKKASETIVEQRRPVESGGMDEKDLEEFAEGFMERAGGRMNGAVSKKK